MKATKIVLNTVLAIGVAFMAVICVKSVVTPIQFEEERTVREAEVITNLISLRTAQAQFRLDKGYFTADLDSLVDYLKTTVFHLIHLKINIIGEIFVGRF